MKNTNKKTKIRAGGFTLIELLITIAILGILASIVAVSVNYARGRGSDTAIISNLHGARTQAQLYYADNNDSYTGICDTTPAPNGTKTINENLLGAQTAWGTTTQALNIDLATAGSFDTVTCHENGTAFAAEAPLKSTADGSPLMYCLDDTGAYKQETTNLGASVVACD